VCDYQIPGLYGTTLRQFMWRPPQPVEEIDTMTPALVYEVPRKA